jgi:hypothetical protein
VRNDSQERFPDQALPHTNGLTKNVEQKGEQKDLKNLQSVQKRSELEVVEKEIVAVENISAFKENPTTLHGEDMRDA